MEALSKNEQHLKQALLKMCDGVEPPPHSAIRARKLLNPHTKAQREDVISFVASFLNLRVKLYHVVIGFVAIWLCYLYFEQKPPATKQEASGRNTKSALAATTNNTLLPSIQTFCQKK